MRPSKRRPKKEALDLDITSLLDILVILLVFLLKSYNASNLQLEVVKNLGLADSHSEVLGDAAVIIQVDKDKNLFVSGKQITKLESGKGKIDDLYQELDRVKKIDDENDKNSRTVASNENPAKKKRRPVNLVFDKKLPYQLIQRVMYTASLVGHDQYKFIVQGASQ